jgi:hypothetical protein
MTTEKLQRLAKNLSGLIDIKDLPLESLFFNLISIKGKYKDYFSGLNFKVEDFVKLFFFTFSYLRTGKFDLGQKYLNNIFFVSFFIPSDEKFIDECGNCNGEGRVDCSSCETGDVDCDECDGTGEVPDPDEEDSNIQCSNCEGSGYVSCSECGGAGREDCFECDGSGEIITKENNFIVKTYLSWNPELGDVADYKYEDKSSISSEEFDRLTDKMSILLSSEEGHGELRGFVDPERYYIYYFSDEGNELFFSSSGNILNGFEPEHFMV